MKYLLIIGCLCASIIGLWYVVTRAERESGARFPDWDELTLSQYIERLEGVRDTSRYGIWELPMNGVEISPMERYRAQENYIQQIREKYKDIPPEMSLRDYNKLKGWRD